MSKETLKLALEALEGLIKKTSGQSIYSFMETERRIAMSACVAIKEALARPEQEPVAWGVDWGKDGQQSCVSIVKRKPNDGIEVVAIEYNPTPSPPQRKPLTDEQLHALFDSPLTPTGIEWARKIEAAHGIKEQNNG